MICTEKLYCDCVWYSMKLSKMPRSKMCIFAYVGFCSGYRLFRGSRGLMVESRTRNWKVVSLSLGPAGIVGGGSRGALLQCTVRSYRHTVRSPPSIPRRAALEQSTKLQLLLGHRCINGCPLLRVCVHCVCVHCCVCALGWVKCRAWILSMGLHTWLYVTSLSFISFTSHSWNGSIW